MQSLQSLPPAKRLTLAQTADRLRAAQDVLILIHRSPDGDCVGGGYALYHILRGLGIRARVQCADPIPQQLAFLTEGVVCEDFVPKTILAVDVADPKLLGDLAECYGDKVELCIDHHVSNTGYAGALLLDETASAACEVLYAMMTAANLPMTAEIAACLYVGMATDTGCFQYSNASASTFSAISHIKAAFALPYADWNRQLFVIKSRGRLILEARLMQQMQTAADGQVALVYLPYAWLAELQVQAEEIDGVSSLPMQIAGVEIGICVKEQPDGSYRVSMRAGSRADVSVVCRQFGGGGHVKAGGCSVSSGAPEEVCRQLITAAEVAVRPV